ncbi:MAG: hypothetical protein WKF84_14645 [Pyrinomonadaceae bacterium]
MLFARFLAENNLLMHPEGVAVTLEECEELAKDERRGERLHARRARYASRMLPQIFRTEDPVLNVAFAPEHRRELERLLNDLPVDVFTADDSLGWVYQFWQTNEKTRVNKSGNKIGADELPAVTQLFTEHYMVLFLLHNTIGAWTLAKSKDEGGRMKDETGNKSASDSSFILPPSSLQEYLRVLDRRRAGCREV